MKNEILILWLTFESKLVKLSIFARPNLSTEKYFELWAKYYEIKTTINAIKK